MSGPAADSDATRRRQAAVERRITEGTTDDGRLQDVISRLRATAGPLLAGAGMVCLPLLGAVWWNIASHPWHNDAYATWNAWHDGRLYPSVWRPVSEYPYAPAFAQVFWPLTLLPWGVVHAAWAAFQLAVLTWMLGPLGALLALAFPFPRIDGHGTAVYATINNGNPMILVAGAITLGLTRWPGAFAFVLLTKVSAGIGIVYFALRREWRKLGLAVGVTAGIVVVSAVFTPHLWVEWAQFLHGAAFHSASAEALAKERFLPVPMPLRSLVGLALIVIAAWRGWLWAVAVGCFLALPDIHLGGFAVLTAAPAVWLRLRRFGPW